MEYIKTDNGLRLLGQGQAVVVEVESNLDDNHRVKIKHPDFGETPFIPYIQTSGMYKVPAVGEIVYVFCREAFESYPMAWGSKLHDSAVKALLGNRDNKATVIYSTGADHKTISHKIVLDDGADRGIRITTQGGNEIDIKNSADIDIKHHSGPNIKVNGSTIKLTIGGSTITMTSEGIDINSGNITINGESVKVTGSSEANITGGGSSVDLGDTATVVAGDGVGTFDGITVSTHNHKFGNLGIPTEGGPLP